MSAINPGASAIEKKNQQQLKKFVSILHNYEESLNTKVDDLVTHVIPFLFRSSITPKRYLIHSSCPKSNCPNPHPNGPKPSPKPYIKERKIPKSTIAKSQLAAL